MASYDKDKFFDRPYDDFDVNNSILNAKKKLIDKVKTSIEFSIGRIFQVMDPARYSGQQDASVYTGLTGIAMMYLLLYHKAGDKQFLVKANELVKQAIKSGKFGRSITFLTGDAGVFAVSAVINDQLGHYQERDSMLQSLISLSNYVRLEETPDELLYGRAGYLYALLFVRAQIPNCQPIVTDDLIVGVIDAILESGQITATREKLEKPPLMYYWHGKAYIGAAHGFAGILHTLLLAWEYIPENAKENLIKPTIDFVLELKYKSGNYQSSLGSETDRLVQWCHGSPGVIHMLVRAYQIFKEEKYLESALQCGDIIWERGLLKKGYGICHGVAGNAYAFLKLYQLTKKEEHLYRAVKFGLWIGNYNQHGCRTPDRPYSLFEGSAGAIYFLTDLLDPENSAFPAYEIPSFGANIQERMV